MSWYVTDGPTFVALVFPSWSGQGRVEGTWCPKWNRNNSNFDLHILHGNIQGNYKNDDNDVRSIAALVKL